MNAKALRKKAEELVGFGYSRQHMYDVLTMEHPEVKRKRIAHVVRYVPSEVVRAKYAAIQQGLLAAIGITVLLHLAERWGGVPGDWRPNFAVVGAIPFASIFLGLGLLRWRGEALPWLVFVNAFSGLGILRDLNELLTGVPSWYSLMNHALALVIAVLAWYLYRNAFSKPEEIRDPLGHAPVSHLFPPEPVMYRM